MIYYVINSGLSVGILVLLYVLTNVDAQAEVCSLAVNPSSLPIRQMFENQTTGYKILELLYQPANASISLGTFTGNLAEIYKNKFELRILQPSVLALYTSNETLRLPQYPSKITNVFLTIHISCNGNSYPITVLQIKNANARSPVFYRTPYIVEIPEATLVNSTIDTPILAIDWDPSPSYTVAFKIENEDYQDMFQLDQTSGLVHTAQNLPLEIQNENWTPEQLPSVVKLRLLKSLDYDTGVKKYVLNIMAIDHSAIEGVPSRSNRTTLEIHVVDSDDMPPVFEMSKYNGNISQDAREGEHVQMENAIVAKDGDKVKNSRIKYSLNPESDYFKIDSDTGVVSMKKPFVDNQPHRAFDLFIKAEQADNPNQASTALLHIEADSSDQYSLSFRPCVYNVTLPENSPPTTQVVQLIAEDPNHGAGVKFIFVLVNTTDSENFSLNNRTGLITVSENGVLDRENQSTYSLSAIIKPMQPADNQSLLSGSLCPTAKVFVTLLDENDNSPTFSLNIYNFTITDTISKDGTVGMITATDKDIGSNGQTVYKIIDQNSNEDVQFKFSLLANGSAQVLIDFLPNIIPKWKSEYQFYVEASDKGIVPRTSRVRVTVNVAFGNSHPPVFDQATYNVSISENLSNGSRVAQVRAVDLDEGDGGSFSYSISDATNSFAIDQYNGWITVLNENNLDRETTRTFTFTVGTIETIQSNSTAEGGKTATVFVTLLDVNDNAPKFSSTVNNSNTYEFTIDVSLEPGSKIGKIEAVDADEGQNGKVTILPISVPSFFDLTDDGTITLASSLKSSSDSLYNLIFEARDNPNDQRTQKSVVGMAKIFVTGIEVGKEPKFTNLPSVITISESFPVNTLVFTVTVTDPDAPTEPIYRIIQGNENKTFKVEQNLIQVNQNLDAELITVYDLLITYEGKRETINGSLKISVTDSNDNAPKFERSKFQFFINDSTNFVENMLVGQIKAGDADVSPPNSEIVYSLDSETRLPFNIDPKSGELRLTSVSNLTDQYIFSVIARDRGEPSLRDVAFVTVDVNRKSETTKGALTTSHFSSDVPSSTRQTLTPPKFTQIQYAVTVPENSESKNITWVVATHSSGTFRYAIETPTNGLFQINPVAGVVTTTGPLDYESVSEYRLNVSACLNGVGDSRIDVCGFSILLVDVIDQNDHSPKFNQTLYATSLPTDAVLGSRVIRVTASDEDSGVNKDISYALKYGAATFAIDYETGWITTVAQLLPKTYNITVEAYDHGRPSMKTEVVVIVSVNGTNPHEPEFEYFVYEVAVKENSPIGSYVVQTVAHDPDPGEDGRITYNFKQATNAFTIDETSGKITTTTVLDFESTNKYDLVVEAVDHAAFPRSATTVVAVTVLDTNDNPPIFEPLPDRIYISSAKPPGSAIFTMKATDVDSAKDGNSVVVYSVLNDTYFYVPPLSNALTVRQNLLPGNFTLILLATDNGQPPLNTTHPLHVVVTGDSLLYPLFKELSYDIKLGRNATLPQVIQKFQTTVKTGDVVYQLIPENTKGLKINSATGDLTADPEIFDNMNLMDTHYLIVRAVNTLDKSFFSDVSVTITVTNYENLNIPLTFTSTLYRAMIKENSPSGTNLNLTVSVNNSEAFGDKLKYWLYPNDTFSISDSGEIFSVKPIDLESLDQASDGVITIQVFANNGVSVTSTILQVKVVDINEFAPQFNSSTFNVKISENVTPGTVLFHVQAEDKDFDDKRLRYQLLPGDGAKYVVIESNGNVVKSTTPLFNRETNSTISFTIQAIDQGNKTTEAQIVTSVQDENDNTPEFLNTPYVWNITEGSNSVGKTFNISAKDNDEGENSRIRFTLLEGNSRGNFLLTDKENNQTQISVVKELSRDEHSQLILVIEARDNGRPPLFSIATIEVNIIDVNNNAPKFYRKFYPTHITANYPTNISFLTVYAEDTDQNTNLSFKILADPTGSFQIDTSTGRLFLAKPLLQQNATYNVSIEVSDGQHTDQAIVNIVVLAGQDTSITEPPKIAPQFTKSLYNFSAVENSDNGFIGKVEFVPENNGTALPSFRLSIEPESYREYFAINETGYIYAKKPLQYLPDRGTVSFLVVAEDNNKPPLKVFVPIVIEIVDVNDHLPEFSQPDYVALVPDGVKKGYTVVLDIRATDLDKGENAAVAYTLQGPDAVCFQMDNKTAQITLLCDVNFYQKNSYVLQVLATDRNGRGNASAANVTLIISPPQVVDNSTMTPTPTPWTNASCDSINFTLPLDSLSLMNGTRASTPIYVLPNAQSLGADVLCKVTYFFSEPVRQYFNVSPTNGLVKVAKTIDLAKMTADGIFSSSSNNFSLTLNVTANLSDGRQFASPFVNIQFVAGPLDSDPERVVFDAIAYKFELAENEKIGTFVGHVNASANSTSELQYTVLFTKLFSIPNPNEGVIISNTNFDFDGANKELNFIVQVTNGRSTDFALVSLSLLDVNDNSPEFGQSEYKFEIPEGPYNSGATIGYVDAHDKDNGLNALLNYSIVEASLPFRIDSTNGRLQVFGNIDREQSPFYTFHVMVTDSGEAPNFALATVNISVIDVNDNPPMFYNASTNVFLPENLSPGQFVTQTFAVDPDEGANGRLAFRLLNYLDTFAIGQEDGIIRNLLQLSSKRQDTYYLSVVASDFGKPPLTSVLNITIKIVNGSLGRPVFGQDIYYKEVSPSLNLNDTLLQVSAGQGLLVYSITDGNNASLFDIDEDTGEIRLRRTPRNDEHGNGFSLSILAKNISSGDTASTTVRLYIVDRSVGNVTVSPPSRLFDRSQYWVEIAENLKSPVFVIDLNSTLEQEQKTVAYKIVSGSSGKFTINETTGIVYTNEELDRENQSLYIMTVQVRLVGKIRIKRQSQQRYLGLNEFIQINYDEAILVVNITDVNDNAPDFSDGVNLNGVLTSAVDTKAGQTVGSVKATDKDSSSVLTYSILSNPNDDSSSFSVDPKTGVIIAAKNFDELSGPEFRFIVIASDGLFNASIPVVIYKLLPDVQAVIEVNRKPEYVQLYVNPLEKSLSKLTNWNVSVASVRPSSAGSNLNKSELYVYAIDPLSKKIIDGSTLSQKLASILPALQQELNNLNIQNVVAAPLVSTLKSLISGPEIALIVVSSLIILLALLGLLFMLRWWKKKETERLNSEYMLDSQSSGTRPYEVVTVDSKTGTITALPSALSTVKRMESKPNVIIDPNEPYETPGTVARQHRYYVNEATTGRLQHHTPVRF